MKENRSWYDYTIGVCIILVLAVIPLFVSAKYVNVSEAENLIRSGSTAVDVFSYYKSLMICFVSLFMTVVFLLYVPEKGYKKYQFNHPIFFCGGAFILFVLISFLFTSYKEIALSGITERFESMWVLISYMLLMIITFSYCINKFRLKLVVCGIFAGAFIIGIVGLFQYFGMDVFKTEFGAKYVLGNMYDGKPLTIKFEDVYSLLYNPNCVGMFSSMLLPFTVVLAVSLPSNLIKYRFEAIIKYISIALSIILVFNLIGSNSEGGIAATFAAFLFAAVIAFIYIIKNKKYKECSKVFAFVISALVIIFVIGSIFIVTKSEKIQNKISQNIDILTGKSDNNIDYGYYFKDFSIDKEKNRVEILVSDGKIFIDYDKNRNTIQISDENQILVPFGSFEFSKEVIKAKEDSKENTFVLKTIDNENLIMQLFTKNESPFFYILKGKIYICFSVSEDGIISAVDKRHNILDIDKKADSIGFKGSESFATGRGYIWSRSMPLVFSNGLKGFFAGSGPDSFALAFPQYELKEKLNYLGNPYIIVDKPHNFYLQTAINTGLLSVVAFIVLFAVYIFRTIKNILKDNQKDRLIISLRFAFLIGIIGYLVSALATDSVVSVAPTFWIMLGAGFAVTELT